MSFTDQLLGLVQPVLQFNNARHQHLQPKSIRNQVGRSWCVLGPRRVVVGAPGTKGAGVPTASQIVIAGALLKPLNGAMVGCVAYLVACQCAHQLGLWRGSRVHRCRRPGSAPVCTALLVSRALELQDPLHEHGVPFCGRGELCGRFLQLAGVVVAMVTGARRPAVPAHNETETETETETGFNPFTTAC